MLYNQIMEPFIIRSASANDAKAIAECHKEAVEKKLPRSMTRISLMNGRGAQIE